MNGTAAPVICPSRSGHIFVINSIRSWGCPTANFENVMTEKWDDKMKGWTTLVDNVRLLRDVLMVLLVRGYFNWAASMAMLHRRRFKAVADELPGSLKFWFSIAQEAVGATDVIGYPKTMIRYEDFRDSARCRKSLCAALGGVYNESELQKVPHGGDGSSFDGRDFDGRASEMRTDERCIQIMESEYRDEYAGALLGTPDVMEFYVDNFEMAPAELQVYEEITQ